MRGMPAYRLGQGLVLGLLLLAVVRPAPGRAQANAVDAIEGAEATEDAVFARVLVASTPLRSGPGPAFRRIGQAHRGQTFRVLRRSTRGYYFLLERPDGTTAWILGDTVYNYVVGEGEAPDGTGSIFAPPPLSDGRVEVAALFGVLAGGGFVALRPSLLVAPAFGLEATAAISVSRAGRLAIFGGGGIINIAPNWPVVPYLTLGGGVALSDPNADTFLLEQGRVAMLYGGGGLRIGFKHRLTLRIEARAYAFFEADRYLAQEEISGGLSVFF